MSRFRGDRLRELRLGLGLSQDALAELLDVGQNTVHRWEAEQTDPSTIIVVSLADVFETSADYLLGRSDVKHHKGKTPNDLSIKAPNLTTDERKLLAAYRRADLTEVSRLIMLRLEQELKKRGDIPGSNAPDSG